MTPRLLAAFADCFVFHKVIGFPADLTASNFKKVLIEFQTKRSILADGDPGPVTLWELQIDQATGGPQLPSTVVKTDMVKGYDGYPQMALRQDAAQAFDALAKDVRSKGGVVTSSGGCRPLEVTANAHQSSKSMHYPCLAFDLSVTTGAFKPATDPFLIERTGDAKPYWRVWCRAPKAPQTTITATYFKGWKKVSKHTQVITDNLLDFTALAATHGFGPIGPRASYTVNGNYMGTEWWHFQYESALVPRFSQLGIELIRIDGYDAKTIAIANAQLWGLRRSVFGIDWH